MPGGSLRDAGAGRGSDGSGGGFEPAVQGASENLHGRDDGDRDEGDDENVFGHALSALVLNCLFHASYLQMHKFKRAWIKGRKDSLDIVGSDG